MTDGHLGAIAVVGGLVLSSATLLWHVLRSLRVDLATHIDALRVDVSSRLDTLNATVATHVASDAASFAAHQTQLVGHEKRLDRLDAS